MTEPQETDSERSGPLCGDDECPVCTDPMRGTCADGFSNFVEWLNGGDGDE